MERKKYLVVTAGGSGTRMGSDLPKQFLELGGRAVLQRTIEQFLEACPGIKVVTVLPEAHMTGIRPTVMPMLMNRCMKMHEATQ